MRPYPEELLRIIQTGIGAHFGPEVQTTYGKAQIAFSMLLFMIAQKDYDTAVPDLLDANKTLRTILTDARDALGGIDRDDARAARASLAELPATAATLKLSDLRREHEALRATLGALAPIIEPAANDDVLAPLRDVRTAAFAYLAADAQKRRVPIVG